MNDIGAAEPLRIATTAAAAVERGRLESIMVLERKEEFILRTTKKIGLLVERFFENLGDDIHDMLCDNNNNYDYRGLNSDRDTEEEVETAIRFFPDVLSRRSRNISGRYHYPIDVLPKNLSSQYFLYPLVMTILSGTI
jgi:hypothetical protein